MENITEEISDINMKENKNDIKLLQNKTKSGHKNNKNKNKKKKCEENIIKEKKEEIKFSNTLEKKVKYKFTIKPEYIKIKEENSVKKTEIDCSFCSDDYKLNDLYNWIHLILEEYGFYFKKDENKEE